MNNRLASLLPLDIVKYILTLEGSCIFFGNQIMDIRHLLNIPKIRYVGHSEYQVRFDISTTRMNDLDTDTNKIRSYKLSYNSYIDTFQELYVEHIPGVIGCYVLLFVWRKE
jgi:hypothetical protein